MSFSSFFQIGNLALIRREKQQQQKHIKQEGRNQRSKKPMINMFAWKVDMANRTTKKSISSQACKLCPMFYAYKTLFRLNFHLVNNSPVQACSIIWLQYWQEKSMNWFSPQFCTIVLVWGVWLLSLAPWKNLKSKRIKLIRRKGQLKVKRINNINKMKHLEAVWIGANLLLKIHHSKLISQTHYSILMSQNSISPISQN